MKVKNLKADSYVPLPREELRIHILSSAITVRKAEFYICCLYEPGVIRLQKKKTPPETVVVVSHAATLGTFISSL